MARFNMFYYKSFYILIFTFLYNTPLLLSQGNCLLYNEGSGERKACELCYHALSFKQGSKASQSVFDQAIRIGPKFAYSYYQKSVPFFKRGLLADGVHLINKAIELEPQNYLYYRAYWYFYNRSYENCIRDLEELYTTHKSFFTTTPGGELEMRLLLAMAYAHSGNVLQGIVWIKNLMETYKHQPNLKGYYDHFCLGVLYYQNSQFKFAKSEFEKQISMDENFADTYYYLGLIMEKESEGSIAKAYFNLALTKMKKENDGYSINLFTEFNTYLEDVEKKLLN